MQAITVEGRSVGIIHEHPGRPMRGRFLEAIEVANPVAGGPSAYVLLASRPGRDSGCETTLFLNRTGWEALRTLAGQVIARIDAETGTT